MPKREHSRHTWRGRLLVFSKRRPDGAGWIGIGPDEAEDVRYLRRAIRRGEVCAEAFAELDGFTYAVALGPPIRDAVTLQAPEMPSVYQPLGHVIGATVWHGECAKCGAPMMVVGPPPARPLVCPLCAGAKVAGPLLGPYTAADMSGGARCVHCGSPNVDAQYAQAGGPPTYVCRACGGISYSHD